MCGRTDREVSDPPGAQQVSEKMADSADGAQLTQVSQQEMRATELIRTAEVPTHSHSLLASAEVGLSVPVGLVILPAVHQQLDLT